jgi:uncharacterized protein YbjT (DUF2867 family)
VASFARFFNREVVMALYVVAGASGHVGSVAAIELLSEKEQVKALVRDEEKGADLARRGAQLAVGELEDKAFVVSALKGAAGFFTLLPPNYQEGDFYATQRRTADAIAAAVAEGRVPHVVLLSSIGADLADKTGPIKGLHYLEVKLRETGVKLTAIRSGYFQENAAAAVAAARAQGIYPNFTPSADYAFPMIATRDVGALVARCLRNPPARSEVIDLHGPAYSPRQLADKIGAALKKKLQIVDVPAAEHVAAYQKAGLPKQVAEAFAEMNAAFGTGRIVPKGDRAETGKTTFDETLRQLLR